MLVILCFASFLVTGRGHLWCCWLGLVEASNPFLCLLSLMRQVSRRPCVEPNLKPSSLHAHRRTSHSSQPTLLGPSPRPRPHANSTHPPKVPALKATMFYYVNGFLLWLAYVVFRVVSPLFSVHYMYVEMRDRKDVAWVSEDRSYNGKRVATRLGVILGAAQGHLGSTWGGTADRLPVLRSIMLQPILSSR